MRTSLRSAGASLRCGERRPSDDVRQLTLATVLFLLSVGAIVWFVSRFVLEDFSQAFLSRVIVQAQAESEEFARLVNESPTLGAGEGDPAPGQSARPGSEIDPELLLGDLAPQIFDADGNRVATLSDPKLHGRGVPEIDGREGGAADGARRRLITGRMETQGQEWQYRLNGQLVGRDAVQFISIRFPGGFQHFAFRRVEGRYVDPALRTDPSTLVERVPVSHRPSSRTVLIAWESEIAGQPAQLEAAIDADILDAGVAEIRRLFVPKVVSGGALFVLLLAAAYVYVLHLLRSVRRAEAAAAEQALLGRVGLLAAGLAHEIRNPLTAVQMNLQLLEEDLAPTQGASGGAAVAASPPERQGPPGAGSDPRSLFRATQREVRRLATLVNGFLAYARPARPDRAPRAWACILQDCVDVLGPMAAGVGVTLETELPPKDAQGSVDEAMIKQALMNLVINAVEAAPKPGGHVRVSARRAGREWHVLVEDDGPGLPADAEPLFRAFQSTKQGGTGLGLAISRALVEQHGGRLEAGPRAGGGASFRMVLPAEDAA